MRVKSIIIAFIACLCIIAEVSAQTSDSLIVNQLEEEGVKFSHNNSVTLLMSGQKKEEIRGMVRAPARARTVMLVIYLCKPPGLPSQCLRQIFYIFLPHWERNRR